MPSDSASASAPDSGGPSSDALNILSAAVMRQALQAALLDVDASFLQQAAADNLDDGSTAVAALLLGSHLMVANVGNSRAVMCSTNSSSMAGAGVSSEGPLLQLLPRPLSRVHELSLRDERERVEAAGGRVLRSGKGKWRLNGELEVSRWGLRLLVHVPIKIAA